VTLRPACNIALAIDAPIVPRPRKPIFRDRLSEHGSRADGDMDKMSGNRRGCTASVHYTIRQNIREKNRYKWHHGMLVTQNDKIQERITGTNGNMACW